MEQSTAEQHQETQPVDTVQDAASALSGLLNEDGTTFDAPEPEGQTDESAPAQSQQQTASQADTPATIALKIGDREFQIPVKDIPEEFRDQVKDGLLMRADYSRKTMELAEKSKAVDARDQRIMQTAQTLQALPQHFAAIQAVEAQLANYQNVDWQRLRAEDPSGIAEVRARQDLQDLQSRRTALYGELQRAHQGFQAYQAQGFQERLAQELPKVKEAIPDFGDAKVKEMREGAIKHYGKYGITDALLNGASNAYELAILNDALQFRALQEKAATAANKVQKLPPKQVQSGVASNPGNGPALNQSAMQRLQRSGKTEDAAAAIKSLLG